MSEYLLSTSGLTKQFGHHKAVNNVDLHVKKGAIYGCLLYTSDAADEL